MKKISLSKRVVATHLAMVGGIALIAGCSATKVMDDRAYVPAAKSDFASDTTIVTVDKSADTTTVTEKTVTTTAAPTQTALPRFDETEFTSTPATAKSETTGAATTYTVKKGDTVGGIAMAHKVSTAAVLSANNLTIDSAKKIQIGQKLTIPAPGTKVKAAATGKKASSKPAGKAAATAGAKAAGAKAAGAALTDGMYVVQSGDNIPKIAKKLGVKASALMAANNLTEEGTKRLQIGQKLVVPGKTATGVAAQAAPVAASDKSTNAALDAIESELAKPAPVTAPAATTAATSVAGSDIVVGNAISVEVESEVKLEEFAKQHKTTVETLQKLNHGDLPKDGILKVGAIVFIPSAE